MPSKEDSENSIQEVMTGSCGLYKLGFKKKKAFRYIGCKIVHFFTGKMAEWVRCSLHDFRKIKHPTNIFSV